MKSTCRQNVAIAPCFIYMSFEIRPFTWLF